MNLVTKMLEKENKENYILQFKLQKCANFTLFYFSA